MSERPDLLFAALVTASLALMAGLLAGLVVSGGCQISSFPSLLVAALSACFLFVEHMHRVPISWLVLVVVVGASVLSALYTIVIWGRARRLLAHLPLTPIDDGALSNIAAAVGTRLYETPAAQPVAFCTGLFRPRIVVTSGLLGVLTTEEQAAAVWHESHHAHRREPLKCLVGRVAINAFFWIPVLRDLFERYLLAKELVADRLAIQRMGVPALAGALSVAGPTPAGALGLNDLASVRVARLSDPNAQLPPLFSRRHLVATAVGLTLMVVVAALPWTVDIDPVHLKAFVGAAI